MKNITAKYTLKIISDGRLQATNVYLVCNGKQLFELYCFSVEVKIDFRNLLYGTVDFLIKTDLTKERRQILSEVIGNPIKKLRASSSAIAHLPISDINLKGKTRAA